MITAWLAPKHALIMLAMVYCVLFLAGLSWAGWFHVA